MPTPSWAQITLTNTPANNLPRGHVIGPLPPPPPILPQAAPVATPTFGAPVGGRGRGRGRVSGRGVARRGRGGRSGLGQMAPIPGEEGTMVQNNAGGFVYKVASVQQLRRFLVLGSSGGTYYVTEKELTLQNALHIKNMIENGKGDEVVETVLEFSVNARTPKQDTLTFALALAYTFGDASVRTLVYKHLSAICRIPTTLFGFLEFAKALGGTSHPKAGRGMRSAIARWYKEVADDGGEAAVKMAYTCTKYKNRNGWTHRDVMRIFHVKPDCEEAAVLYKYLTQPWKEVSAEFEDLLTKYSEMGSGELLDDFVVVDREGAEEMSRATEAETEGSRHRKRRKLDVSGPATMSRLVRFLTELEEITPITDATADNEVKVIDAIKKWKLAREHVPSPLLGSRAVWAALLEDMPMTAMIRNLPKMTVVGLIAPLSEASAKIARRLRSAQALKKAKVHPFNVLMALRTYERGHGIKGSLSWTPDTQIVAALEDAYYLSFQAVEPTGKRFLLALDVSGSMCAQIMNSPLSCREAAAALCMVTARTEEHCHFFGFMDKFVRMNITRNDRLETVVNKTGSLPFGGTDCALPMVYALKNKIVVDVFVVYTDCETYYGKVHPKQALAQYRETINKNAKLVVVGMTATQFTIADPEDAGMMDIVGFDSGALQAMGEFVGGNI